MTVFSDLKTLVTPIERLPEKGQRVRVICIKEMIFEGDSDGKSSLWKDDGEGSRCVMLWEDDKIEEKK